MTEVDPLRNALEDSIALSRQDKHEEALKLLNKSIADAIRERQNKWISALGHHAAVISEHIGNLQLVNHYCKLSVIVDPTDAAALFHLADVARRQGEAEIARHYAARCHKVIVEGSDENARKGLLNLILLHWPELAEG